MSSRWIGTGGEGITTPHNAVLLVHKDMSEELRGGRNGTGDSKLGSFCYKCLCFLPNVLEKDGERGEEGRKDKDEEERGRGDVRMVRMQI